MLPPPPQYIFTRIDRFILSAKKYQPLAAPAMSSPRIDGFSGLTRALSGDRRHRSGTGTQRKRQVAHKTRFALGVFYLEQLEIAVNRIGA
jgi:hypothetical protein